MTRPEGFAFMLDFLGGQDAQVVEAYVTDLEEKVASLKEVTAAAMTLCDVLRQQTEACQAREAYLREVLEAQPRRMAWVRIEGVDQELPDYATRLRDQALAAPQDRTALDRLMAGPIEAQRRLGVIRELCGHVEDGSSDTLRLFQDDATRTWFAKTTNGRWMGGSFEGVLDAAERGES